MPIVVPARGIDGSVWVERALEALEVGVYLEAPIDGPLLRAPTLAWCARFDIAPATRSMLGRHSSCLNETFAIYSRDLVCAPVAELQGVIDAIHDGSFTPDCQRSEFFKRPANCA